MTVYEPRPKSIFVMMGWIPYLYVCVVAIKCLVLRSRGDDFVYERCFIAGFLSFLAFVTLWQTNFFSGHDTTTDDWNRFLAVNTFITLFVAAGTEVRVISQNEPPDYWLK